MPGDYAADLDVVGTLHYEQNTIQIVIIKLKSGDYAADLDVVHKIVFQLHRSF